MSIDFPDTTIPVDQQLRNGIYEHLTIASGATTGQLTPTANTQLHEFSLNISSNATLATGGMCQIDVILNGTTIRTSRVFISSSASGNRVLETGQIPLADIIFPVGTGNLVVNISPALTAGELNFSGYFA